MWGVAFLDLRGEQPRIVLARDHFGIKPMYYARSGDRVLFASEIKAILQDSTFERHVDDQQMYEYLAFGLFDHTEATFFEGVRTVPAAAYAIVDDTGVRVERYWEPMLSETGSRDPADFRAVFDRAVERAPRRRRSRRHLPERRARLVVDLHGDGEASSKRTYPTRCRSATASRPSPRCSPAIPSTRRVTSTACSTSPARPRVGASPPPRISFVRWSRGSGTSKSRWCRARRSRCGW